jgi:hypothetical protein
MENLVNLDQSPFVGQAQASSYPGQNLTASKPQMHAPHMSRMLETLRESHGRISELDKLLSVLSARLFGPESENASGAGSLSQVPNGSADEATQLADGLNGALQGLHGRVLRLEQRL